MFDLMIAGDESRQTQIEWIIDTPDKAQQLLPRLLGAQALALDTEGTGLEPGHEDLTVPIDKALDTFGNDLFAGFSIATSSNEAWYVPTRHYQARCLSEPWVRRLLDGALLCPKIYMHHSYHDLKVLNGYYHEEVHARVRLIVDTLPACHTLFQGEEIGTDKKSRNVLGLKKLARQISESRARGL